MSNLSHIAEHYRSRAGAPALVQPEPAKKKKRKAPVKKQEATTPDEE